MTKKKFRKMFEVEIRLPLENIKYAIEGANIGYWTSDSIYNSDDFDGIISGSKKFIIVEDDDGTYIEHKISRAEIVCGLVAMAEKAPHHFRDLLGDDPDMDMHTGDVLIQCAIFGEVKYS